MIQMFHRDACARLAGLGPGGDATIGQPGGVWRTGTSRHRPFFRGPSPGKVSDGMLRSNRWRSHPGSGRSGCATQSAVRITT